MPMDERPSKEEKEQSSKDSNDDKEPKEKDGQKKNGPNDNGHEKGKTISRDFKERWEKAEKEERPAKEEAPSKDAKPVGIGLFKQKMGERKGQSGRGSFLTPALADAARKAKGEAKMRSIPEAPGTVKKAEPEKPTSGSLEKALEREAAKLEKSGDTLDRIIGDLKGHREEFLKRRKEELEKDAIRPRTVLEPHLHKLKVIKEEMEKKKREEHRPDVLGFGFSAKEKEARIEALPREEELKSALKVSMDKAVRKGSIIKRLDEVLGQPMDAIEEESSEAKQRLLDEIGKLDVRGFEGRVNKLLSKVKKGKIFQAERDLLNLKIAMEAQRSREQLKRDREERLEAHLSNIEKESSGLEDVVSRHVKALEIEMDQTNARIQRDLRKLDTTGFEHVVKRINEMIEEGRAFDAEEQLQELKLALKARELRDELRSAREERIISKVKASMPSPLTPVEAQGLQDRDLLEEIEETKAPKEPTRVEDIGEVQCGVCGTILQEGAKKCPACGTSFVASKTGQETTSEEVPEAELEEFEEGPGEPLVPQRPTKPEPFQPPGPPKPPEEPELSEIQCGVCGSIVPSGAKRCRACGTLLTGPEFAQAEEGPLPELGEPERYPSLVPLDEKEGVPELVPLEEEEGAPELVPIEEEEPEAELVPIEEEEGFPLLAPADEEESLPQVVPGKGMKCPECAEFSPIDSIICVKCGASLGIPILEPIEPEEGLPELVPVGPDEEATEEHALEEVLEPIDDEVVGEQELEPEVVEELEAAEAVEGVPWSEPPEGTEKELEWRRLCVRAKRFFNEGRVKAALEAYDEAIEIKPSFDAYYGKGEALLSLGWTNSALDCINQALDVDDERLSGWILKAKALEALGKYTDAIESLDRAIAIDEESPDAWHLKGTMLMAMGRVEDAVRALDHYVGIKPTPAALREAVEISKKALTEGIKTASPTEELEAVEAEELEGLRSRPEAVSARQRRYRSLAKQRGLTNGFALVNGRGLTNGRSLINGRRSLINGRSKVNGIKGVTNGTGKGLINGRGLVNGASGLVNGRAMSEPRDGVPIIRIRKSGRARALQVIGVMAVVLLGILAPIAYFTLFSTPNGIIIDGQFSDWSSIAEFQDQPNVNIGNPDITITSYTMSSGDDSLFFYVQVSDQGKIFNGRDKGVDILRIYIDTDGNSLTGYFIGGIGADRMVEAYGWNSIVKSSNVLTFDTARNNKDWNGWMDPVGVQAAIGQHAFECRVSLAALGTIGKAGPQVLIIMTDTTGHQDTADAIITSNGGALVMDLADSGPSVLSIGSSDQPLMSINLRAMKNYMGLSSLTFYTTGNLDHGLESLNLKLDNGNGVPDQGDALLVSAQPQGQLVELRPSVPLRVLPTQAVQLFVTANLTNDAVRYSALGLSLDRTSVQVVSGAVTVNSNITERRYIGAVPTQVVIDGAFDDWSQVPSNHDTVGDGPTPSLDIADYRTTSDGISAFFYMATVGTLMYGSFQPGGISERPVPSPPSPGPPGPPQELGVLKGEDALLIMLDTDKDNSTGYKPSWATIGAEYELRVLGKGGIIDSAELYSYDPKAPDGWTKKATVPAQKGLRAIELGVSKDLLGLGPTGAFDAAFLISDWDGKGSDSSDTFIQGDPALALVTDGSGAANGDQLGFSVANAGDVNGDGIDDVITGAPYDDTNATDAGSAYIFFGRAKFNLHNDLNASKANVTLRGLNKNGHFGWSVSGAGDVNGDGYKDVIIGEPDAGPGHAYIFYGRKAWKGTFTTAKANVTIDGEVYKDKFGYSVAGPGNVNNANNADVLVGAPYHSQVINVYQFMIQNGRAYVFYGDGSIPTNATNADIRLDGEYNHDNFGISVAGAGDVNKDGIPDIIIGGNGTIGVGGANIFYGGSLEDTVMAAQMTHSGVVFQVDLANRAAQSFTPKTNGRVRFVDLAITDTGVNSPPAAGPTTNILQFEIQTDNNGAPSGIAISSREGSDFAQLPNFNILRFTLSTPATVNANTRYWIVATCPEAAGNGYGWLYRQANVYAGGFASTWNNNVWTAQNSIDMMFNALVWPDVVHRGENPGDGFGFSVDGAGDTNKDGFADTVIGAPFNDAGGNNAGRAYIFNGSANLKNNIFAEIVSAFPPGYGRRVDAGWAAAQSFTAPANGLYLTHIWWAGFEAQVNPGALTISLQSNNNGAPSGVNLWTTNIVPGVNPAVQEAFWLDLELSPNVKLNGNTIYWIVATNNNQNNQGYGWFEQDNNPYSGGTGARRNNNAGNWQAQAYELLFMVRGRYECRITGTKAGDEFGYSVSSAGDINKDGRADIAIGAPYADNGASADTGAVYTFLSPLSFNSTAANANYTNYGNASNDHFGWSVDGGDFNKDGYSEILVGAPGYDKPAQDAGQASVWRIPEFKDIVIPIIGTIVAFGLVRKRKARVAKGPRRKARRARI